MVYTREKPDGGHTMYRILIVDDEAKIREVLAEYAEFEGFASDQAADGMEAVNKCKNEYNDAETRRLFGR